MYENFNQLKNKFDIFFSSIGFVKRKNVWIYESKDDIIVFKLRKNTHWETVYLDYGILFKYLDLPLKFGELDWHLDGTLGIFDSEKYASGISCNEENLEDIFDFVIKTVLEELKFVALRIKHKDKDLERTYKYVVPASMLKINEIERYVKSTE